MSSFGYRDPWVILGVDRSADDAEIKRAFRSLALKFHPDRNPDDEEAKNRFQDAADAFDSIKTEDARSRWLADNEGVGSFPPFPDQEAQGSWQQRIERDVEIDFRDAFTGKQIDVIVEVEDACSVCGGSGAAPGFPPKFCQMCKGTGQHQMAGLRNGCAGCDGRGYVITNPCAHCRGGMVVESRPFLLSIPPGAYDGYELRVPGPKRGRFGSVEIVVRVSVSPSPVFARTLDDRADLLITVPITYSEACFGAQVRIPTPARVVELKIPPATSSGQMFRIRGEGMPELGSDTARRGNLYAKVEITVPEKLSRQQRKLIEQLASHDPDDPRFKLFEQLAAGGDRS